MIFTLDYLIGKNMISRIPSSKLKAQESIKTAESWLFEAKTNLEN